MEITCWLIIRSGLIMYFCKVSYLFIAYVIVLKRFNFCHSDYGKASMLLIYSMTVTKEVFIPRVRMLFDMV